MNLQLSLWENSKTFLEEAIAKAVLAETNPLAWKFAILALVQAIELAVKERLRREHPILVFADVDKAKLTVSLEAGLKRLESIASVQLEPNVRAELTRARDWRNEIVHASIDARVEQLKPAFACLLGFHANFCHRHLGQKIYASLSGNHLAQALAIEDYSRELMRRAEERLVEEKIEAEWTWSCRSCGFDAFVVQDQIDTCYLCGFSSEVVQCDDCQELVYLDECEAVYLGNGRGRDAWEHVCQPCFRRHEDRLQEEDSLIDHGGPDGSWGEPRP